MTQRGSLVVAHTVVPDDKLVHVSLVAYILDFVPDKAQVNVLLVVCGGTLLGLVACVMDRIWDLNH